MITTLIISILLFAIIKLAAFSMLADMENITTKQEVRLQERIAQMEQRLRNEIKGSK
jgi:type II secretory pathway component PulJ